MKLFQKIDDAAIKELAEEMFVNTYKMGDTIIEFGTNDETYDSRSNYTEYIF